MTRTALHSPMLLVALLLGACGTAATPTLTAVPHALLVTTASPTSTPAAPIPTTTEELQSRRTPTADPTNTPTDSPQPPPNFDFVFSYGSCITDRVDTFRDRLTRKMEGESEVISFSLSRGEKATIYRKMQEIKFFTYPEHFSIPIPEIGVISVVEPADTYAFRLRSGRIAKTLRWTDHIVEPTTPEADRLRELVQLMERIVAAQPEMEKLRAPSVGCQ